MVCLKEYTEDSQSVRHQTNQRKSIGQRKGHTSNSKFRSRFIFQNSRFHLQFLQNKNRRITHSNSFLKSKS